MNFQGINGNGRVVISSVTQEEKETMQANPAYNFVTWIPLREVAEVEAPAEVEDAEPVTNKHDDGDSNVNVRAAKPANRGHRSRTKGSDGG